MMRLRISFSESRLIEPDALESRPIQFRPATIKVALREPALHRYAKSIAKSFDELQIGLWQG
jgi:hypothetical protein